jgi:hypothetical protein
MLISSCRNIDTPTRSSSKKEGELIAYYTASIRQPVRDPGWLTPHAPPTLHAERQMDRRDCRQRVCREKVIQEWVHGAVHVGTCHACSMGATSVASPTAHTCLSIARAPHEGAQGEVSRPPTCCLLAECCIFHRRRQFGDWSDDDDSDQDCGDCSQPGKEQGQEAGQQSGQQQASHPGGQQTQPSSVPS